MNDTAFVALADEDRRQLLSLLASRTEGDPSVRIPEDLVGRAPDPTTLSTRLHHVHLPKLASMDYVEWDSGSSVVRRGPAFEELVPLLSVVRAKETLSSD